MLVPMNKEKYECMKNNQKYAYQIIRLFNILCISLFINVFYGFLNYNCLLIFLKGFYNVLLLIKENKLKLVNYFDVFFFYLL